MLTGILISIAIFVIVAFVAYSYFKPKQSNSENSEEASSGQNAEELIDLPDKLKEPYRVAMNPTANGKPVLFALITCHHCVRTQRFLKENNIDYTLIHVDLFDGVARENIMATIRKFNPRGSFPTFVMPNGTTVVGFREPLLREALQNDSRTTD